MVKNILYITYVDYEKNEFPGVQTKIDGQSFAMKLAGYEVNRVNQYGNKAQYTDKNGCSKFVNGINKRFAILNAVKILLKNESYIAAYIRFQFFSEDVRQLVKLLHKSGTKVIMEIPTFPYEGELHQQGKKGEIKLLCDKLFRYKCAKYIDRFINIGKDREIYKTECINIKNGFDFSSHPIRNIAQPQYNTVNMIAVASMLPWHGYDRILIGMGRYYEKYKDDNDTINFILHLVGEGKENNKYQELIKKYQLESHVVLHGMKSGKALMEVVNLCSLAIGSLAAYRAGIEFLSTLKSREYCAWGLPSVNATKTDILSENNPYVLYVPEDETPINMESVLNFYHDIYFKSGKSAKTIAEKIRSDACEQCDIKVAFQPVIDFIERG